MLYELVVGTIRDFICFHLGRTSLLLVTFGKYPPSPVPEHEQTRVVIVGSFVLVGLVILLYYAATLLF